MVDQLTAQENRLYRRLFALATDQRQATARLNMGMLGFWGRLRLRSRQTRLETVFHRIVARKMSRMKAAQVLDDMLEDLRLYTDVGSAAHPATIAFAREMVAQASGRLAVDARRVSSSKRPIDLRARRRPVMAALSETKLTDDSERR